MRSYANPAQVNVDHYTEWIQLVADFTVNSLQSWQWASGSVFYLLGLWSRLVSSMPYLKSDAPSLLETYVPKITEAYITSRSALPVVVWWHVRMFCAPHCHQTPDAEILDETPDKDLANPSVVEAR